MQSAGSAPVSLTKTLALDGIDRALRVAGAHFITGGAAVRPVTVAALPYEEIVGFRGLALARLGLASGAATRAAYRGWRWNRPTDAPAAPAAAAPA